MQLVVNLSFGSEKQETRLLINCNEAEQDAHVYAETDYFCTSDSLYNRQPVLVVLSLAA